MLNDYFFDEGTSGYGHCPRCGQTLLQGHMCPCRQPQPSGWICPKCGSVYSPSVMECSRCCKPYTITCFGE